MKRLFVVIHNIHSVTRLIEAAKVTYGFNIKNLVISKAIGSAAQEGVPEVQKIALKLERNVFFLRDLDDVISSLNLNNAYIFVPRKYANKKFNPKAVLEEIKEHNVALVFGGSDPGFTKKDLEKGTPVYLDLPGDIGSIGYLAVTLYTLYEEYLKGKDK